MLLYSSWFGDLGGGELRMIDHLRGTVFDAQRTLVLVAQPGRLTSELNTLGIRSRVIRWHRGSSFLVRQLHWSAAWLRTWATLVRQHPAVVVCNTFFDLESTGRVAARLNLPLVWRARADTFPGVHAWPADRLAELVSFLNRRVACILPTTAYEARLMIEAGVDTRKVHVIYNGVDLRRFEDEEGGRTLREQMGLRGEQLVIACVARMVPQKGYETFFEGLAIAKSRGVPVHAIVAGDTTLLEVSPEKYKRALREQVERLHLAQSVTFLGFRNDVWTVMKAADVFVLPSLKEPFGTTVVEAMAASRPVIASDLPGPRESVVDGETGVFFAPGDAHALADRLVEMYRSPARRTALGQAGRARAELLFDVRRNVTDLDRYCLAAAGRVSAEAAALPS